MRKIRIAVCRLEIVAVLALSLGLCPPAAAAVPEDRSELDALHDELQVLRREYEDRIAQLEARLAALESTGGPAAGVETPEVPPGGDELENLRAEARAAAGVTGDTEPHPAGAAPVPSETSTGHERNLNLLNPELSFVGDVLFMSDQPNFLAREFEVDLQSALDPFSFAQLTLAFENERVEIEEGYIRYTGLPGGFLLRGGKMRQTYGVLNRYHLHALPQENYPLVIREYLGAEGLVGTGVSIDWFVPRPWASANEVTLQVTDSAGDVFESDSLRHATGLLHLKNYWDVSPASYLEWGLSGVGGHLGNGGDLRVWGTDLTYHWQPPGRAKYRELTWRSEIMLSQLDDPTAVRADAWGGYTYLEGLLMRNLYGGARFDLVQDPVDPTLVTRSIEPYLTWWQSEFVRLRGSWQRLSGDPLNTTENRFMLQLNFAAGPHKHENY